jgi:membrane fusion protein, macrolide-specific efflux system
MKKNIRLILIGVVALVIIGGGYRLWSKSKSDDDSFINVAVKRGDIVITILTTGTVQPENRLEIKPPIAGRIDRVLIQEGQFVRKGTILAWMSSTERAALLDAARSQGAEEVKRWEDLYRPTPVIAPINGTVILRSVEAGQTFTNTESILVMSDRLTVKAQVDETDMAQVKLKQKAELILDAYPGQVIPAVVDQIAYEATNVNNVTTYVVDVLPLKTPEFMRAGMTANVSFRIEESMNTLLLPVDAINKETEQTTVAKKTAKGEIETTTVSVGLTDGKNIEILSGLTEGDIVQMRDPMRPLKDGKRRANPFAPNRNRKSKTP